MVSSSVRRTTRRDAETQTDEVSNQAINHSRSSNSLIGGHSPPMYLPSVSGRGYTGLSIAIIIKHSMISKVLHAFGNLNQLRANESQLKQKSR